MKIITESDLLKIVNKVLNEQTGWRFNKDEIDILHFIFERELKPPFRKGESGGTRYYRYYNRDGEHIGWLDSTTDRFAIKLNPFLTAIGYKVCQVIDFLEYDTWGWWHPIEPHLNSWMEDQMGFELTYIGYGI